MKKLISVEEYRSFWRDKPNSGPVSTSKLCGNWFLDVENNGDINIVHAHQNRISANAGRYGGVKLPIKVICPECKKRMPKKVEALAWGINQ